MVDRSIEFLPLPGRMEHQRKHLYASHKQYPCEVPTCDGTMVTTGEHQLTITKRYFYACRKCGFHTTVAEQRPGEMPAKSH